MCFSPAGAQTVHQTMYIDFGEPDNPSRGQTTEGADLNGNYWTNVFSSGNNYIYPGTTFAIVNSSGEPTGYEVLINVRFMSNGKSGGGGLTEPSAELLGDLAVATATEDYLFMESFQNYNIISFRGLDPQKGYIFHSFGSRQTAEERAATFLFAGENTWSGDLRMSGDGIGTGGYNGNNDKILVSDAVFPDNDGTIKLVIMKKNRDGMVHLNAMKIEETDGLTRPGEELTMSRRMYIDIGETDNDQRGHCTTGADKNGNYWNNLSSGSAGSNRIPQGTTLGLTASDNTPTGYTAETLQMMETNGVDAGGVNSPKDDDLGDLAIQTATEDYVWINDDNPRQIRFSGLDVNCCYRFYIFGSRITSETDDRNSIYTVEGMDSWSTQITTSGRCIGGRDGNGNDVHGNLRNVATSDYVYPDKYGNITFTVQRERGMAHVNAIKIEEYSGGTRPSEALTFSRIAITGTASENGGDVDMQEIKDGSGVFEAWLKMQPGTYQLAGTTADGADITLGEGDADGSPAVDGPAFGVQDEQVVRVKYDSKKNRLDVTPVELYVKGNIVPDGTIIEYAGNGTWQSEAVLDEGDVFLFSDKYIYFAFNNDDDLAVKRLTGSRTAMAMPSEGFATENIRLNKGTYTLGLDMRNHVYTIDAPIDEYKISVFGSSVANGQGATDFHGYAYDYGSALSVRYERGESVYPFTVSGVSIGGNNTVDLLGRYDEMIHDFGRYVIFGLSLGNEGVHEATNKQAVADRFRDNMLTLIAKAREDGKVPVIMNNYTRGDYTADDYSYVKQINMLIHEWDLPSVNVLGAIDNGAGRWADSYMADNAHPTTLGHMEFFYAMPVSLFDALTEGKPMPERDMSSQMTLGGNESISFRGERIIHPYTISVRMKGGDAGRLLGFTDSKNKQFAVSVGENGMVSYTTADGSITGSTSVNDGEWHTVTLTHYYAQKRTLLYVDDVCQGEISERMILGDVTLGDADGTAERTLGELFFWRSAMTPEEVAAVSSGKMLKSSLEIYVPLSDTEKENPVNLAQTLNTVTYSKSITDGIAPAKGTVRNKEAGAYGIDGRFRGTVEQNARPMTGGVYIVNGKKAVMR